MRTFKRIIKNTWKELRARWGSTSPYLFRIIQKIAATFTFLSGLFLAMDAAGIKLPEPFNTVGSKTVIISAVLTYIVSKLPIDADLASEKTLQAIENNKPADKPKDGGPE